MAIIISEQAVERAVEQLNQAEEAYESILADLGKTQPVLLAYLFSETFEVFTQKEKDFFLYLTLVVWQALRTEAGQRPKVTEQQLAMAEDHNWALLAELSTPRFHERLDVFFKDSPQEELLAFAEDALSDSDDLVTKEGREAMFVSLKSIIDTLLPNQAL